MSFVSFSHRNEIGKWANNGQTCIGVDYLLIHSEVKDRFLEELVKVINTFYGENPFHNSDYERIQNLKHFQRLSMYTFSEFDFALKVCLIHHLRHRRIYAVRRNHILWRSNQ